MKPPTKPQLRSVYLDAAIGIADHGEFACLEITSVLLGRGLVKTWCASDPVVVRYTDPLFGLFGEPTADDGGIWKCEDSGSRILGLLLLREFIKTDGVPVPTFDTSNV